MNNERKNTQTLLRETKLPSYRDFSCFQGLFENPQISHNNFDYDQGNLNFKGKVSNSQKIGVQNQNNITKVYYNNNTTEVKNFGKNLNAENKYSQNTENNTQLMKKQSNKDNKVIRIIKIKKNYQDFQNTYKFAKIENTREGSYLLIDFTEYRNLEKSKRKEFNRNCEEKFILDSNSMDLIIRKELLSKKKENKKIKLSSYRCMNNQRKYNTQQMVL